MVENPPASVGDMGSIPDLEGTHMPMCHSYWACALESESHDTEALVPRASAPLQEKPQQWEAHALQPESSSRNRN